MPLAAGLHIAVLVIGRFERKIVILRPQDSAPDPAGLCKGLSETFICGMMWMGGDFVEIRYMRAGEAAEVSAVYAQSWRYAYRGIVPQDYLNGLSDARWVNNLSRNEMKNLVMVEDGVIIGTTGLCKSRWASHEAYGEIVSIYLLPEYIGKGYGKQLLFSAIAELEQMRFQDILLWVLAENHSARKFYEIHEFTPSGETQNGIIGGKVLKELLYTRQVVRRTSSL